MQPASPAGSSRRGALRHLPRWIVLALLAATVPAAGASPPSARVPSAGAARQLVTDVRDAIGEGSLTAVLEAAGLQAVKPAGTSAGDPVAALAEAVRVASGLARSAVPEDASHGRFREDMLRSILRGGAHPEPIDAAGHRAIDSAAAMVATAIDAALPAMRSAAGHRAAPGGEVVGCDVVDRPPALCVAGTGANVLTTDYALVVDQGGSDLHTHAAGGADPLGNGLPVSVTIDLGGNDRYETSTPTAMGSLVAQGAGFVGGVGFLVDTGGDDTYRIAAEGPYATAVGQGKGEHGFGLLADLAGNDTYELSASGPGWTGTLGQGDGANGAGVLLDREGSDRYAMRTTASGSYTTEVGLILPPSAAAVGLGAGRTGTLTIATPPPIHVDAATGGRGYGLLADGGGSDTLDVDVASLDPEHEDVAGPMVLGAPLARSWAMGYGEGLGDGLLVLGAGATESSLLVRADALSARADADGMGFGAGYGVGVLSDAGGDDVRRLTADIDVAREASAGGCSGCAAPVAVAGSQDAVLRGMGYGWEFGMGLLEDDAGADRYLVSATNTARSDVVDARGAGPPARASSQAGAVRTTVQGVGELFGRGELVDAGGNDRYEILAGAHASSTATREGPGPEPETAAAAGASFVAGQAAGLEFGSGRFTDLGGADVYVTSSTVTAETNPAGAVTRGTASAGVLASVDLGSAALFTDGDGGAADAFSASPAVAACTGTRGQAAWADCGGGGIGLMA